MTALVPVGQAGPLTWLPHELAQAWFGDKVSVETREAYLRDGWHWMTWCAAHNVDPLTATPGAVRAWIDDQRTGRWFPPRVQRRRPGPDVEATIARRVSVLSRLYEVMRGEGATTVDPLANVTRPRVDGPDDARVLGLDARTARRLLAAADAHSPRMAALVWLLVGNALRVSEALGLDVADLSDVRGHRTARVMGKGRRVRTATMPPDVWHRVDTYLAGRTDGPVFTVEGGSARWHRVHAWRALRRLGVRVGLPGLHPHQLRHTSVTFALDAGEPLDRVADFAGHASVKTTMRYRAARDRVDASPAYGVARLLADTPLADPDGPLVEDESM